MRNKVIKTISVLLVFVISLLALSSCGFRICLGACDPEFPEGYTGGFGRPDGSGTEFYWVETYDELLDAIAQLKSHGSTFEKRAIFTYNGDLFDTKYCIAFYKYRETERIKYGENPYDRYAKNVSIKSYGFYNEVSIDEIVYSDIDNYDHVKISFGSNLNLSPDFSDELIYDWFDDKHDVVYIYNSVEDYKNDILLDVRTNSGHGEVVEISDECLDAIINSIVVIGNE